MCDLQIQLGYDSTIKISQRYKQSHKAYYDKLFAFQNMIQYIFRQKNVKIEIIFSYKFLVGCNINNKKMYL